jgi:2-polyprenyl-3-methyl-5-hydroxy-6-metoxy-1,4-benzoquinol methylase
MDDAKLQHLAQTIARSYEGALVSGMVYLGDELGLYEAMNGEGPLTSLAVAAKAGLHERFVREWLHVQVAAGILDHPDDGLFELSAEAGILLADQGNVRSMSGLFDSFPQRTALLAELPRSFRTGIGVSWADTERGGTPARVRWMERFLRPWYEHVLIPEVLPKLEGVLEKLEQGARVADVGCGSGVALVTMAKAFPQSNFHGWDISGLALDRGRENALTAGVSNVAFADARHGGIPGDGTFDLVTTFDCLHDMTHPDAAARAIREALSPDGTWLIVDPAGRGSLEENLQHPMAVFGYAASVAGCLQSGMSEPGGAGCGCFGLPEPTMRDLMDSVGFTRFRRLDVTHPLNNFYEVRN